MLILLIIPLAEKPKSMSIDDMLILLIIPLAEKPKSIAYIIFPWAVEKSIGLYVF
jgi:hypothetical protein